MTSRRPAPTGEVNPGEPAAAGVSPLRFRRALSRFVSGVTVVTTAHDGPGGREAHGMTANAFTSVSLRPPLVLVSVSTRARLDPRIAGAGRYGVSVLGHDQELLARHFAGAVTRPDLVAFEWRDGLPLIAGALAQLTCTVGASYLAGDHRLYIGQVESLWYRDGEPLVFYTGSLRPGLQRPEYSDDALGF